MKGRRERGGEGEGRREGGGREKREQCMQLKQEWERMDNDNNT